MILQRDPPESSPVADADGMLEQMRMSSRYTTYMC